MIAEDDTRKSSATAPRVESGNGWGVSGYVSEIFRSIQGEGLYVGKPQVFVRTAGCSLRCRWCDTQYSQERSTECVVDGRARTILSNPLEPETVVDHVLRLAGEEKNFDTVCLTGGEPLEQPEFVGEVARPLRKKRMNVHLETNGVHAQALAGVLSCCDVVAMDFKLESAVGTDLTGQHLAFLSCFAGTEFDPAKKCRRTDGDFKRIFIKIVIDPRARRDEFENAVRTIASVSDRFPLVLQPESGALLSGRFRSPNAAGFPSLIEEFFRVAQQSLRNVRVIPQCHKILQVR